MHACTNSVLDNHFNQLTNIHDSKFTSTCMFHHHTHILLSLFITTSNPIACVMFHLSTYMQLPIKMKKNKPKDKHTKICTSKGSRDRRIRLSANTAIQFYDVQDRLGFDRPSNAIDWLMKEAKAAIDVLNNDHHFQELLVSDTTTNSLFNISRPFHRTSGDLLQNMNQDHINGFNKSQFETPVVQDADFSFSSIRRRLSWNNTNYNEAQGFEVGDMEHCQSSFHPSVDDINALKNESYGLLGISFEEENEVQQKVDDGCYDQVFESNCC